MPRLIVETLCKLTALCAKVGRFLHTPFLVVFLPVGKSLRFTTRIGYSDTAISTGKTLLFNPLILIFSTISTTTSTKTTNYINN